MAAHIRYVTCYSVLGGVRGNSYYKETVSSAGLWHSKLELNMTDIQSGVSVLCSVTARYFSVTLTLA